MEVATQTGTVILQIRVSDEVPGCAAAIANGITSSLQESVRRVTPQAAADSTSLTLTRIQQAAVPEDPSSPQPLIDLGLGLVVGISAGIGLLALRQMLDTRLRSVEAIRQAAQAPVLGGIGEDPGASACPLVMQADPCSPRAESFRTLRTNLQFLNPDAHSRSFVITSSVQGEGKSTTAVNLAISLRQSGERVLLVDADMRRPKVAEDLGLEGAVGLSDVLAGGVRLEDVIQRWGPDDLAVLPAGTEPPNPNELLGSERMNRLLHQMHEDFDVLLFDTPPLLPVSDAAMLAALTCGAILVVASGRVSQSEVAESVECLATVKAQLLGVVPTRLPTRGPDVHLNGRYQQTYSYTAGPVR
ncbi:polysaccharide biosynthesis tyrosine autokinase [Nesterenkonia sp.]|uniref:polysaccharide biosynthesis tyrosine autokinase n=1 Tax=Nesterenkonia sp. TaxID=704201 RepID=UPI0026052301|nr:polysaccharide biosynthesis tyrosine autokinase [Nesterenkonia sp.]